MWAAPFFRLWPGLHSMCHKTVVPWIHGSRSQSQSNFEVRIIFTYSAKLSDQHPNHTSKSAELITKIQNIYFAMSQAQGIVPDYQMFLFSESQRAGVASLNKFEMTSLQIWTPGWFGCHELFSQIER